MSIDRISNSDIASRSISNISSRPNAPKAMGGGGMSSEALRERFDALAKLAINKLNELIDLIHAEPNSENGSILGDINTGISKGTGGEYSLSEIVSGISSGDLADLISAHSGDGGLKSLSVLLAEKAPLASPSFSGSPTAPTPSSAGDSSSRIATTAWVKMAISSMSAVIESMQDGTYGNIPIGGHAGEVLAKTSDEDHCTNWININSHAFDSPTAETQAPGDNTNKVATTAFVKAAIDALKDGADEALDTLDEIASALYENEHNVTEALLMIASKDNKTTFQNFNDGTSLDIYGDMEYRLSTSSGLTSLGLNFSSDSESPEFICSIDFNSSSATAPNIVYYNNAEVYSTGDDCTDGVFIPIRGKHYTWVLWYSGGKYQGVVRRSE